MKPDDAAGGMSATEVSSEAESGLSRWSRRKQAARTGVEEPVDPAHPTQQEAGGEAQEPKVLTDEEMPPLESLDEDSDYTGFLSPGVSDELRKLALRKLFHGPTFNLCDGLDDYDEDFTNFAKLGDVVTAEMRRRAELETLNKVRLQESGDAPLHAGGEAGDDQPGQYHADDGESAQPEPDPAGETAAVADDIDTTTDT